MASSRVSFPAPGSTACCRAWTRMPPPNAVTPSGLKVASSRDPSGFPFSSIS